MKSREILMMKIKVFVTCVLLLMSVGTLNALDSKKDPDFVAARATAIMPSRPTAKPSR